MKDNNGCAIVLLIIGIILCFVLPPLGITIMFAAIFLRAALRLFQGDNFKDVMGTPPCCVVPLIFIIVVIIILFNTIF